MNACDTDVAAFPGCDPSVGQIDCAAQIDRRYLDAKDIGIFLGEDRIGRRHSIRTVALRERFWSKVVRHIPRHAANSGV